LGLEALPYQTTIFPIQMNGWSYDYMLAIDDVNCEARGKARTVSQDAINKKIADLVTETPALKPFFDKDGAETFCDYLTWAYIESIELSA
jgi:hypothetical protein